MQVMGQEEKVRYMTTAPVRGLVCRLAVPTIISMLVTSFYNMADTFFVGKINTSATAAVGVVFSLMAMIQAVGFFFGQVPATSYRENSARRNTSRHLSMRQRVSGVPLRVVLSFWFSA